MMTNLFSIFDPLSMMNLPLNWMSSLIFMLIIPTMFWIWPPRGNLIFKKTLNLLHSEMKTLLGKDSFQGSTLFFLSIFLFILINNFLGLFPYIFTSTSHMVVTLSMATPIWVTLMLFGWINQTKFMFAHLVPMGTPNLLMPFMVMIETVSNVIRPLTLAVRLSANMIAGHLIMTLLGNQTSYSSGMILTILIFIQILLIILEMAVASIQSYVFTVLASLYSSEITNH
uniref:ATP synthase subunit a n=1 Tax=Novacerus sp. FZ-2019 TaxID=2585224 RepID=A0A6H0EXS5_9HEXA|nr:ATP synthase F0 subunit 6 [Novacerus sp. FZ-2019]